MDANTCYLGTIGIRELALYSHVIPAAAILVLGFFAFQYASDRAKAGMFLAFTLSFAGWLLLDLIPWVSNSYPLVAATWAPLDFINIVFFLLLFFFVYTDFMSRRTTWHFTGLLALAALVPFLITVSGNAVYNFDLSTCEMQGNDFLAIYKFGVEMTILFATLLLGVMQIYQQWSNKSERMRVALIAGSIFLFMGAFSLAEYESVQTEIYEIMLYTLFSLPIFILTLTLAITSYGTFRLGDMAVKALFYVFMLLAATQFFYVGDMTEFFLAAMSFGVITILGLLLFRSNEREIQFRHQLEFANQQQESLLHFISHEVKGFLADGQNAFAGIVEGDFGEPPAQMKGIAQVALGKMRNGVSTVMDILDAANLKKGTVTYTMTDFDAVETLKEALHDLKAAADVKGLIIECDAPQMSLQIKGDRDKLKRHVFRNLIDNAIRYTPHGTITIRLSAENSTLRLSVKDNGVGITPEDMQRLFTEGGHGKQSIKVNVASTGYGLFVAKSVVTAHSGKIWAESEGEGKGSTFVVELPISK